MFESKFSKLDSIRRNVSFWNKGVFRLDYAGNFYPNNSDVENVLKAINSTGKMKTLPTHKILIDLNVPLNKLKQSLEEEIQNTYMIYSEASSQVEKNKVSKYEEYLRVYDLKINSGVTLMQIAEKLYPKEYDNALGLEQKIDIESLVKRVTEYNRKARLMINGGYRHIR